MSHSADSRAPDGIGILILRHNDFQSQPPTDVSCVRGLLGKSVEGVAQKPRLAHLIDDADSIANVMPDLLWAKATRPAPGRFLGCAPAVTGGMYSAPSGSRTTVSSGGAMRQNGAVIAGGGMVVNATPGHGSTVAMAPEMAATMLPVHGETMLPDQRFCAQGYNSPKDNYGMDLWPRFPEGMYGIALPATNEERQVNLFLPTDPRLIAVNFAGDWRCGSMVCDLNDDGEIDPERTARLQSALRVVRRGIGQNSLAFQLSRTGQGDTDGGMFFDANMGNVIGLGSRVFGGCLDVGGFADRHQRGVDADGNPINPLHLALESLIRDGAGRYDGPLYFEGLYPGAQRFGQRAEVHFTFDDAKQAYRWWAEIPIYIPNKPTGGPPPPDKPDIGTPWEEHPKPPTEEKPPSEGPNPVPNPGGGPTYEGPGVAPGFGGAGVPYGDGSDRPGGSGGPRGGPETPGWAPPRPMGVGPVKDGGGKYPGAKDDRSPDEKNPPPIRVGADTGKGKGKDKPREKGNPEGGKVGGVRIVENPYSNEHKPPGLGPGQVPAGGRWPWHPPPGPGWKGIPVDVPTPSGAVRGAGDYGLPPKGGRIGQIVPGGPTPNTPSASSPRPTEPGAPPLTPPAMVNEIMLPSIIGRPQSISSTAADLRYNSAPPASEVTRHDRTAPVTFHQFFYGAQGGAVGSNPLVSQGNLFDYTERPFSGGKFANGTGNGGSWICPPEAGPEDMATLLAPVASRSTTYFGLAPGCWYGAGYPDLAAGGMFSGYRWGTDSSGNLIFSRVSSAGVATQVASLSAAGVSTGFGNEFGAVNSAPQSVSSGSSGTALVNVTGLGYGTVGGIMKFRFNLTVGAALIQSGVQVAVTCPAGGTLVARATMTDTGGASRGLLAAGSGTPMDFTTAMFAGNDAVIEVEGTVIGGGSGDIQLQFAQSTAVVPQTTIAAGGDGNFTKVA